MTFGGDDDLLEKFIVDMIDIVQASHSGDSITPSGTASW